MATIEAYSETHRDQIEAQLSAARNKRELMYRRNNGITVIAYWLVAENVCTIFLHDILVDDSTEFVIPNDQVLMWHEHPFAHRDANLAEPQNDDGA